MKRCKHEKQIFKGNHGFDVCALTNGACTGPDWCVGPCPSFEPEVYEMVLEEFKSIRQELKQMRSRIIAIEAKERESDNG